MVCLDVRISGGGALSFLNIFHHACAGKLFGTESAFSEALGITARLASLSAPLQGLPHSYNAPSPPYSNGKALP